jgi:hypothetical protein
MQFPWRGLVLFASVCAWVGGTACEGGGNQNVSDDAATNGDGSSVGTGGSGGSDTGGGGNVGPGGGGGTAATLRSRQQVVQLEAGSLGPRTIAALTGDGTRLYWSMTASTALGDPSLHGIYTCDPNACATPTLLSKDSSGTIALSATDVYWVDENIKRCAKSGCNLAPTNVGVETPLDFVLLSTDSTYLHYLNDTGKRITRCDLPDCGNPVVITMGDGLFPLPPMRIESSLFFAMVTPEGILPASCPIGGCGPVVDAIGGQDAAWMTFAAPFLYWFNMMSRNADGSALASLRRLDLRANGGPVFELGKIQNVRLASLNNDARVAVDAQHIYAIFRTSEEAGRIVRCPKTGCAPSGPEHLVNVTVGGVTSLSELALDSGFVYWAETNRDGASSIFRAAKEP